MASTAWTSCTASPAALAAFVFRHRGETVSALVARPETRLLAAATGVTLVAFALRKAEYLPVHAGDGREKEKLGVGIPPEKAAEARAERGMNRLDGLDGLDVLINCAGILGAGRVLGKEGAMPLKQFAGTVMVNLVGSFNVAKTAAELMQHNAPGVDGERGDQTHDGDGDTRRAEDRGTAGDGRQPAVGRGAHDRGDRATCRSPGHRPSP